MNLLVQYGLQNALVVTLLAAAVWTLTRLWRNPLLGRTLWLLLLLKLVTPPLWQLALPAPAAPTTAPPLLLRPPAAEVMTRDATSTSAASASGWVDDGVSRGPNMIASDALDWTPLESNAAEAAVDQGLRENTAEQDRAGSTLVSMPTGADVADHWLTRSFLVTWEWFQRLSAATFVVSAWLGGSLVLLLLIGRRTWRFARHLRQCEPASAEERSAVEVVARRIGLSRAPAVQMSTATHPPLVWCLGWRPVLVLPRMLMQQLNGDERTTVLAHELAHIKRGDHLVRLLEAAVMTLFWWHPVVWWARRELQRCEEQCCDADVLRVCPDCCETYAGVLVKTVEFLQHRRPVAVAFTSAMAQRHSLVERIERILGDGHPARWSWASRLTACALVALLPFSVGWGAGDEQTENPTRQTASEADDAEPSSANPPDSAAASKDSSDSSAEATPASPTGLADARSTVQFKFEGPQGLKVHRGHYGSANDEDAYIAPFRIDLPPGAAHPLTLRNVPEHAGLTLHTTLEVAECDPQHAEYFQHNSVPIELTAEDLDQAAGGNFVIKVIYVPDRDGTDAAGVKLDVLVSTRLDPELDPVAEAERRGTIVAVLRLGNRAKARDAKQPQLVPFDRPYGELGFPEGQYGPHWETVRLATHAAVQDELGLTNQQRRRLTPVYTSLMQKDHEWSSGGSERPNLLKEEYDRTRSILTDEQLQRLDQIIFRRLGFSVFLQPQYAEQIGLTPEQSEQFLKAWMQHVERSVAGWDGNEGRHAYHKLQVETFVALSPEQRQRYKKLIGDPVIETVEVVEAAPPKTAPPERSTLMPEFVNDVLHWLPTDIETLIVSRDIQARTIRDDANWKKSLAEPDFFRTLTRSLAAPPLFDLPPFTHKQVEWAILGGRNYEFTSAFGGYRFDGCSVLRFSVPILTREYGPRDNAYRNDPIIKTLEQAAQERWSISGNIVFVFPVNTNEREAWVKPRTGEGLYVAILHDARTMILATSDVFLLQTLRRIDGDSLDRAMPSTLPEWNDIDFAAGTWGIRRVPERTPTGEPTKVASVVWTSIHSDEQDEALAVLYRPRENADLLETLREQWLQTEDPQSGVVRVVQQADQRCLVTIERAANTWSPQAALLFPIQGLPATSF